MKKQDSIPMWLIITDVIYVFCAIVAYNVVHTHFDDSQWWLTVILFLPTALGTWGSTPVVLLNLLVILKGYWEKKAVISDRVKHLADDKREIEQDEPKETKEQKMDIF